MSENRPTTSAGGRPLAPDCPADSEGLLLHIYGEAAPGMAERIDTHLTNCGICRAEMASLRETIEMIDRADLSSMAAALADRDTPGAWDNIASRLRPDGTFLADSRRWSTPFWLKAAAVLVLASASFLAGAEWMSADKKASHGFAKQGARAAGYVAPDPGSGAMEARDPGAALREFTAQTDGYLNRSRIILLEIANADKDSDTGMLREETRTLLAETRDARRIADQIPDSQVDEVLARLESVLIEISSLSDWSDPATVQRIRDQVNDSGLLEQIEILTPPPTHLAHKRIGR